MSESLPPHQRHSATSRAAARGVEHDTNRLRVEVWRAIKAAGARGLTDHEGEVKTGMSGNTYRPRRVELAEQGSIKPSGRYRPTASGRLAMVWVLA